MDLLLLPTLKHRLIKNFKNYRPTNGNYNLLSYMQQLENKYRENRDCLNCLMDIKSMTNLYMSENKIETVLHHVESVELLRHLLFFFEPDLNVTNVIHELERLESILNMHQFVCKTYDDGLKWGPGLVVS